jgi:hypothetical protein
MDTIERVLPSEAKRSERANDERRRRRTARSDGQAMIDAALAPGRRIPRTDGRATDVEIASGEKLLRDLAAGLRNLRKLFPAPYDLEDRTLAQAAKIRAVEWKLFKLRQGRLL